MIKDELLKLIVDQLEVQYPVLIEQIRAKPLCATGLPAVTIGLIVPYGMRRCVGSRTYIDSSWIGLMNALIPTTPT